MRAEDVETLRRIPESWLEQLANGGPVEPQPPPGRHRAARRRWTLRGRR